nr:MAK10-like protein [Tanacetum cinerariifolium]
MENPEQAFVDYASSCTNEAGGLMSNFLASQDARLSKFEVNFKQQQSEMTNKIDTFLKSVNDRMMGALPIDMVKNQKLNVNHTSSVLPAHSYPMEDPQRSSQDLTLYDNESWNEPRDFAKLVKAISLPQDVLSTSEHHLIELENHVRRLMEARLAPNSSIEINKIASSFLDKYIKSLELREIGSAFIQGKMPEKMKDLGLFTLPCRLGDSKPLDTLADLGSCVNLIPLYLFKKLKIELLEEIDHVLG